MSTATPELESTDRSGGLASPRPCAFIDPPETSSADALSPERFEAVLGSISDGVFTIGLDGRITCFNRAAEEITGVPRDEAIGQPCHAVFQTEMCKGACPLRYTMETNTPIVDLVVSITGANGQQIPVSVSTSPFRNKRGRVVGGVETFRDLRQIEVLRKRVEDTYTFQDIVSKSPAMARVLGVLPTIAGSDSTVLITGESGTGKELVARALHHLSSRSEEPFVAVNSAGIPDTLMEAELFGYEPGAFTGAVKAKPGRFARADKGTLFLDEIGELPMPLQAKLLRVLQDRFYEPLGSVKPRHADVRLVVATNRNLDEMVAVGTFRKDLFYRVNVFRIALPPLRERREDIPLLIDHFLRKMAAEKDKRVNGVTPHAMSMLLDHDYPGNVRELENVIEHGFVLTPGPLIDVHHLPPGLAAPPAPPAPTTSMKELERQFVVAALERNGYNRTATARQLGMHKTTLFRKFKRLGITPPERDGRSRREPRRD